MMYVSIMNDLDLWISSYGFMLNVYEINNETLSILHSPSPLLNALVILKVISSHLFGLKMPTCYTSMNFYVGCLERTLGPKKI